MSGFEKKRTHMKKSSGLIWPPFLAFSEVVCTDGHWPRVVTIKSYLMSGCGLNYKSV